MKEIQRIKKKKLQVVRQVWEIQDKKKNRFFWSFFLNFSKRTIFNTMKLASPMIQLNDLSI